MLYHKVRNRLLQNARYTPTDPKAWLKGVLLLEIVFLYREKTRKNAHGRKRPSHITRRELSAFFSPLPAIQSFQTEIDGNTNFDASVRYKYAQAAERECSNPPWSMNWWIRR